MDGKRCVVGHVVVLAAVAFLAGCSSERIDHESAGLGGTDGGTTGEAGGGVSAGTAGAETGSIGGSPAGGTGVLYRRSRRTRLRLDAGERG